MVDSLLFPNGYPAAGDQNGIAVIHLDPAGYFTQHEPVPRAGA
jgi:hypothetical protein